MERRNNISLLYVLIIASVLSVLFLLGVLYNQNISIVDSVYGRDNPSNEIIIIAIDDKSINEIGRWPWNRSVFSDIINKIDNNAKLILIDVGFFEKSSEDKILSKSLSEKVLLIGEYIEFEENEGEIYGKDLLLSVVGNASSHINLFTDKDGISRSIPLLIKGDKSLKASSLVVAEKYLERDVKIENNKMFVNFFGQPGSFKRIPIADIYYNRVNASILDGKIVLIGSTAKDLHDDVLTPVSSGVLMPGIEFHANAIQTIIEGKYLYHQGIEVILIIFLFSLISWIILTKFRIITSTILISLLFIGLIISVIFMFYQGVIINILYPTITIVSVYIFMVIFRYVSEKRQRKWVTSIFGKYVPKEVVQELLKNPDKVNLGGERKDVVVMFSDIRGFTTMSEEMNPEDVVEFLNKYHSSVTNTVMKNKGIVIDYMGDGAMILWGAPIEQKDSTYLACKSAIEMKAALEEISKKIGKDLKIGIGINKGHALVGNIGSEDRFGYSAIGDTTNTAARFEGLNKEYGTLVIISESVYQEVKSYFIARELDTVQAKGKNKPTKIFELLCNKEDNNAKKFEELKKMFEAALELYKKGMWKKAIKEFENIIKKYPNDKPSKLFIERANEFKKKGISNAGIHKMTKK